MEKGGVIVWATDLADHVVTARKEKSGRCKESRSMHLLVILLLVRLLLGLGLVLLSESLEAGDGDSVEVTHTILRDTTTTLGVLLENTNTLETLNDLALNRTGGVSVVRRAETAVGGTTVELSEMADTDSLAKVDVTGEGGGADVEPVWVVRGLLLEVTGLDNVDPGGHLDLAC